MVSFTVDLYCVMYLSNSSLPPGSLCQSMMGHSLEMDKGGNLLCLLSNPGQKMTLNPAQGQLFHPLQKGMIVDTRLAKKCVLKVASVTRPTGLILTCEIP